MTAAEADDQAQREYDAFAAQRRTLLEAEGQRANLAALEAAAKRLPRRPKAE